MNLKLYNLFTKFPVISTDSRCIKENSIFFSLKGNNFNGNEYAAEAIAKGAAFAVIDEKKYYKGDQYILTDNALDTFQKLAIHHRKQINIPVIAITGTNGKTTTKELLYAILRKKFRTMATMGNFNNHIGVPLSVLSINKETEIAIIELGANHPGEITELCRIAQPNYGLITNIGKAHLEGFGTFENIINTKKALYEYIKNNNGIVFVNKDNSLLTSLSEKNNRIFYGISSLQPPASSSQPPASSLQPLTSSGELLENNPFIKLKLILNKLTPSSFQPPASSLQPPASKSQQNNLNTKHKTLNTKLIGEYNFENILAASCIGNYFSVPISEIKDAIENYEPAGYRSQFIDTGRNKLIMDAYNANPTSMEAAINNFAMLEFKNKVAIIGDMFELGAEAPNEHKKIVRLLKRQNFENIILVGPLFYAVNEGFKAFSDSSEACNYLLANPLTSKTIFIKGSRGIKLEKIIEAL